MIRLRLAGAIAGSLLMAGLVSACASPQPTPTPTASVTACDGLTDIAWSNMQREEGTLADVEILTADLDVQDPATGENGWTREGPAPGFPVVTKTTATTGDGAALSSLLASLEAQQVFIQTDPKAFQTSTADIVVSHGGRWIAYTGGTEITADYTATCSGNGLTIRGTFHGWVGPSTSGELECSLVDELPANALGQKVRDYCAESASL